MENFDLRKYLAENKLVKEYKTMKKSELKKIIKEEIKSVLKEDDFEEDEFVSKIGGDEINYAV